MSIKAILEEKAKAMAAHDGLIVAAVTHVIAAANEIVAEARREMDALIASISARQPDVAQVADEPVAEADAPAPTAVPEPAIETAPEPQSEAPDAPKVAAAPKPAANTLAETAK